MQKILKILKILKFIGEVLLVYLGLFGSLASIYAVRKDIFNSAKEVSLFRAFEQSVATNSFLIHAGTALPVIALFVVLLRRNLVARGRVSFKKFLRRFNPLVFARVCIQIHRLEHSYQDLVRCVRDHRKGGNVFQNATFQSGLYAFLKQCKFILDLSAGADTAVHIKLFEHQAQVGPPRLPLSKAVLKAYVRAPSDRECRLIEQQRLRPRENDETFRIITGSAGLASKMIINKGKLERSRFRYCSGYNHAFSDPEHFFLCNDLPRASRRLEFFSTSKDYVLYYRSAGAFLIHHHLQYGEKVNHDPVWGMLIIDSYTVGVFEKLITKYIAGYTAHRLFDLFSFAQQVGAVCR